MNLLSLLKGAEGVKQMFEEVNGRLAALEVEGESGGGLVRVRMNGLGQVVKVEIDRSLSGDLAMVEDLVASAFTDGKRRAEEASAEEMRKLAGGLPLPPGLGFPAG